jgi:hypothetical protein
MRAPSGRILALVPLLLLDACQSGWRNIRDFRPDSAAQATRFPDRVEADARRFGETYLAGHSIIGEGPGFDAVFPDDLDEICLDEILWDTLYRFEHYQPAEWMDQTPYLDIAFPRGPLLRIVFGSPRWTAFPVRGDSTDLPMGCKNCPDSASVRRRHNECRE